MNRRLQPFNCAHRACFVGSLGGGHTESTLLSECAFCVCPSFKLDMSLDVVLYKWHKIKVFIINFSPIRHFISGYSIFCKHIASIKLFLNFPIAHLVGTYSFYLSIFFQKSNVIFGSG